jgi:Phosphotransferase enzyme family
VTRAAVERLLNLGPVAACGALADSPDGLRLTRAQLGSAASSLLLAGEAADEWVLRWPAGGEPAAWCWPHDPGLPVLQRLASVPTLLADPDWAPSVPVGAVGAVERVGYKPGRRATFRVDIGSRSYVLKLVCRADFPPALRGGAISGALPTDMARAPRLVAYSEAVGAVLLEYLPGVPLDRFEPGGREVPLAAVPSMLVALHAVPAGHEVADGLLDWDASDVTRKIDAFIAAVTPIAPDAAQAARPLRATIARRLATGRPPGVVIHGDLTLRNLVWTAPPTGVPSLGVASLGVIDWDRVAIGPREADLSPLVGQLGADAGPLVEAYERASGYTLDRALLDALVHANRLARALRRAASGRETAAVTEARVAAIAAGLART